MTIWTVENKFCWTVSKLNQWMTVITDAGPNVVYLMKHINRASVFVTWSGEYIFKIEVKKQFVSPY